MKTTFDADAILAGVEKHDPDSKPNQPKPTMQVIGTGQAREIETSEDGNIRVLRSDGTIPEKKVLYQEFADGSEGTDKTDQTEGAEPSSTDPKEGAEPSIEADKKVPSGVQRRINELTKKNHDLSSKYDELARFSDSQKQALTTQQKELDLIKAERPKQDSFENESDFQEAVLDWRVKTSAREIAVQDASTRVKGYEQEQQKTQTDIQSTSQEMVRAKIDEAIAVDPEFKSLVVDNEKLPISAGMLSVMSESEHFHDIAKHFGRNPQEAQRVAQMPPQQVAMEVARLEGKIEYMKSQPPPEVKTSSAPPPPPVSLHGTGGVAPRKDAGMSMQDIFSHMDQADADERELRKHGKRKYVGY